MTRTEQLPLVIFAGGVAADGPGRWVGLACRANTLDLIGRAAATGWLSPIVLAAPGDGWEQELAHLPVKIVPDPPDQPFHFGQRLRQVAADLGFPRLLYIGSSAGPLLTTAALAELAQRALHTERGVLANNLYSCDYFALDPVSALDAIDLPATDNDLAWRLAAVGLPTESLPASAATRLDLDTPNDLLVAALHPACGPALRRYVTSLPLEGERVHRILREMTNPQGEVLVYGRVAAATWAALEQLPCQTRLFSEERGLRASGRQARGEVHAWLGAYLLAVGPQAFFGSLARSCSAALLDTRPLLAHLRLWPGAADRFYSDLLQPDHIGDPQLCAFTQAALATPLPLMLGGQSLVSGDLLALAEIAQAKNPRATP